MRNLEDRLSDTLHEKLMARFVDRRTSALMRGLRVREDMLAGVAADGAVTIEGRFVGRLAGEADEAFALSPDGTVLWRGEAAGVLAGGEAAKPRVRLLGELGHEAARQRAPQRLEAFVGAG